MAAVDGLRIHDAGPEEAREVQNTVEPQGLRPREGTQKSQLNLKGVAAKGNAAMRKTKQSDSEQTEPASSKRAWKGIDMNLVDPDDLPPRSRLFVQGKVEQITEDFLQRNFEVFGSLDYIKLLIKSGQRQGKARQISNCGGGRNCT